MYLYTKLLFYFSQSMIGFADKISQSYHRISLCMCFKFYHHSRTNCLSCYRLLSMSQQQPKTDFLALYRDIDEESLPFLQLLLTRPPQNAHTLRIPLIYFGLTWKRNWRVCYYLQNVYFVKLEK